MSNTVYDPQTGIPLTLPQETNSITPSTIPVVSSRSPAIIGKVVGSKIDGNVTGAIANDIKSGYNKVANHPSGAAGVVGNFLVGKDTHATAEGQGLPGVGVTTGVVNGFLKALKQWIQANPYLVAAIGLAAAIKLFKDKFFTKQRQYYY